MRRGLAASMVLAAVGLLTAGCATWPGVDGNLVDEWPQLPEAKVFTPDSHACYNLPGNSPDLSRNSPTVECTASHTVETFYVGAFTGEDGNRTTPPPSGSGGQRKAAEDCTARARAFLGDDWRQGRLRLLVSLPKSTHWDAGARWFRCDLMAVSVDRLRTEALTQSLESTLSGPRAFAIGCVNIVVTNNAVDSITSVACSTPHNGELAGIFEMPDGAFPADADRTAANKAGCLATIASYAGVPNDANLLFRTGYVSSPFDREQWLLGNRGARCYAWNSKRSITGSIKGVGDAGLPLGG